MSVIGVDPGINGALANFGANGLTEVIDMPSYSMQVGRTVRRRVNAVALDEWLAMQKLLGAELVVIEAVGGRPKQSASGGFVLGYCVGLIYAMCVAHRIPIETVTPQVWKRVMRLPGKTVKGETSKAAEDAIKARTLEVLPDNEAMFLGPKGGKRLDRCEAAMLAVYGHRHLLNSVRPDAEWRLAYQNADTGA